MKDLTVVYYTSNFLDDTKPKFLARTKEQLLIAAGDFPMVVVSQKPLKWESSLRFDTPNIVVGDIGRSHLNIYRQILAGCIEAKTEFVAMAEDDIFYSYEHFHGARPKGDVFLYDMNKWSIFTWIHPAVYSFRTKRRVVNQLIAPRKMLIEALEERFERVEEMMEDVRKKHPDVDAEQAVIKYWGDPGRYEDIMKVTVREVDEFYSDCPSIVYSHPEAFGFLSQGKRKKLGDLKALELPYWGTAEKMLKLYNA